MNNSSMPLVSIVLCTYNGEEFLNNQLDSIVKQDYPNLEIIICDDCSIDNTVSILHKYYESDQRIKLYLNEKNLGYIKNFEKAIFLTKGEFIALADQDDIWFSRKIEILINEIGSNMLIHSDAELINENGEVIASSYIHTCKKNYLYYKKPYQYMWGNIVTGCTLLFRRELLKSISFFPIEISHDWWLAIHASRGNKIKYYDKPLIQYRQHSSNQIGAKFIDEVKGINIEPKRNKLKHICAIFLQNASLDYNSRDLINAERYEYVNEAIIKTSVILSCCSSFLSKREKHEMRKSIDDLYRYFSSYYERRIRFSAFFICLRRRNLFKQFGIYKKNFLLNSIIGNPDAVKPYFDERKVSIND